MRPCTAVIPVYVFAASSSPAQAQQLLQRKPMLPNSVTALTSVLENSLPHWFADYRGAAVLSISTTCDLALGSSPRS